MSFTDIAFAVLGAAIIVTALVAAWPIVPGGM